MDKVQTLGLMMAISLFIKNIYSDETCYFVCFDIGEGKRIPIIENNNVLENLIMHYDAYLFHEEDLYNLVNTGRQWFNFSFNYLQSLISCQ